MVHIVFQKNDIETLKKAIKLDETLQGEIIQIEDDFAVGPIKNSYSPENIGNRRQWWREVLSGGDYEGIADDGSVKDDNKTVAELTERLRNESEEVVWIWAGQNQHDVSGYYWLIGQLKDFQGRIFILYLHNLPFINEKGHIFYPTNIFDIRPEEFIKAKKLSRPVTPSEFEIDPDEWTRLGDENKGIRTLEGGKKLLQHEYDYYDAELLKLISHDWQKVHKLLHLFYSKNRSATGDAYLLWRLKLMVIENKIDAQGEIKKMKDFEVKAKTI